MKIRDPKSGPGLSQWADNRGLQNPGSRGWAWGGGMRVQGSQDHRSTIQGRIMLSGRVEESQNHRSTIRLRIGERVVGSYGENEG